MARHKANVDPVRGSSARAFQIAGEPFINVRTTELPSPQTPNTPSGLAVHSGDSARCSTHHTLLDSSHRVTGARRPSRT